MMQVKYILKVFSIGQSLWNVILKRVYFRAIGGEHENFQVFVKNVISIMILGG